MQIDELRALSTTLALDRCAKLDAATRKQLFIACPATDHRILLVLNVVEKLYMDDGFAGVMAADYRAVRAFLIKARDTASAPKKATAQTEAWKHWFYPEYGVIRDTRERFCSIAVAHGALTYTDASQHALFSLNGYFGLKEASTSAHTFSTCGLFIRACRAAARILEEAQWPTNTPHGTDPCITGPGGPKGVAAIQYVNRGQREPKRGDIFHIRTDDYSVDHHVGIILSHQRAANGDWLWKTAEGGQEKGFTTGLFEHVVKLQGNRHWVGKRRIEKWIDLDLLAASIKRTY